MAIHIFVNLFIIMRFNNFFSCDRRQGASSDFMPMQDASSDFVLASTDFMPNHLKMLIER